MASAKPINLEPIDPEVVELRLTRKEAQLIKSILGNSGALTKSGQNIYNCLKNTFTKNIVPYKITPYFKEDLEEML